MKKKFILVASLILTVAMGTTAFAHGGCHGGRHRGGTYYSSTTADYPLCGYADCYTTGVHTHDNCYYSGHYANDGHAHCAGYCY